MLDEVARGSELEAVDPMEAVRRIPRAPEGRLHPASWGAGGYAAVWLDPANDWIYRHLLHAAETMRDLASKGDHGRPAESRALRQAGRELLLAQASDWAFIMKTGTLTPYAVLRTETHLARFDRLAQALRLEEVDERELAEMESLSPLFPTLETEIFA